MLYSVACLACCGLADLWLCMQHVCIHRAQGVGAVELDGGIYYIANTEFQISLEVSTLLHGGLACSALQFSHARCSCSCSCSCSSRLVLTCIGIMDVWMYGPLDSDL
ncbi:hypothetical protein L228DRAFT_121377 [Xylona heveae TC161]|uniref:Secreted protein n=1 Tax=Xylona heveae (strain CBS 132557 / TC161) TaxID=1328760 RepID=A0A165HK83_XYLHT|nr:hypothetical protein L228DRAFT_121377 [Xylona heveae TC161]KZF23638.1 hypothetical protein L228DRAFT_121377 [Xylona heveae TC161]